MRLWHYKLIHILPNAQLIGQWRECCAVAQMWANEHDIRHPLVRPVLNYGPEELFLYCKLVKEEMESRGFKIQEYTVVKLKDNMYKIFSEFNKDSNYIRSVIDDIWDCYFETDTFIQNHRLFDKWHNNTYFDICYWNLYEKYLCECIPEDEWIRFIEGGRELV